MYTFEKASVRSETVKEEMKYFAKMTKLTRSPSKKNAVVMGRKTWESIPEKFRPLPGRFNILVSTQAHKNMEAFPGCIAAPSFEEALNVADVHKDQLEKIWVIGGSSLYNAALSSGKTDRIYLTKIFKDFECDTFLPPIPLDKFIRVKDADVPEGIQEENGINFEYHVYERKE